MTDTLSQYDVTGTVNLEDPPAVERSIKAMLVGLYGAAFDCETLERAIADLVTAYSGDYPGLLVCDTHYHDLHHALESGLTMARLLNGHARTVGPMSSERIDAEHALLGTVLALFHEIGLLRRTGEDHLQGAQLASVHEERGVEFLRNYLGKTALANYADKAVLIMPTKLVFSIPNIWSDADRRLSSMVASSDLLSQISDRCYLEKCRDYLFMELAANGIAGTADSPFPDRETLLAKTPDFVTRVVSKRLDEEYRGIHRVLRVHFEGRDPYDEAIRRNLAYLDEILADGDFGRLRRQPQPFLGVKSEVAKTEAPTAQDLSRQVS